MRMDEDLRIRGEFMTCLDGGSVWKHEMNNARAKFSGFVAKKPLPIGTLHPRDSLP